MIDLTSAPKKAPHSNKYMKRKVIEDSDSDLEFVDEGTFQSKRRKSAGGASPSVDGSSKGKGRAVDTGPSEAVIATWNRGDDDLEPSTKMLALLDYLKEWDVSGDKTICYSQCVLPIFCFEIFFLSQVFSFQGLPCLILSKHSFRDMVSEPFVSMERWTEHRGMPLSQPSNSLAAQRLYLSGKKSIDS